MLSHVKVKRKGQMTIPANLREKFNLREGSVLQVEERNNAILLKPAPPLEAGKIVGHDEYKQILRELETLRKNRR
jgi:AbrB family looped-hinge helix DNA binding protein